MANIANPRLLYATVDTDYSRKSYCLKIRQRFGLLGHAMAFEVLTWISETKGCYAEWTEDTPAEFATTRMFDVSLIDQVAEVFAYMVEIGFFDREAFKAGYLTSEGIVHRWWLAKRSIRNQTPTETLPGPVRAVADRVVKPEPDGDAEHGAEIDNATSIANNDTVITNNATSIANNDTVKAISTAKEKKRKEVQTNKQTNKARGKFLQPDSAAIPDQPGEASAGVAGTPPAPPDPDPVTDPELFVADAMDHPRWDEIRGKIVRLIYSPRLCSDLVDMFAAAAAAAWITVPQVRQWVSAAKDQRDQYRRSKGHSGKEKLWEVLRPLLADVYLAHGMELPPCDPRRLEPPPPPQSKVDAGLDDATRAGRAVMAPV